MPIFEYTCRECGHQFEKLIRAETNPECPKCQSIELEKLLSVFATTASTAAAPIMSSPCGSCPHSGGPGSCAMG